MLLKIASKITSGVKKKVGYKQCLLGVICMIVLCFPACGGGSKGEYESSSPAQSQMAAADDSIYMQENSVVEEEVMESEELGVESTIASNRKLIKNVNLNVETEDFDTLIPKVEGKVQELGGYIESLNIYNGSTRYGSESRNAYMTIRVPKDKLNSFVSDVAEISNIINREENTQDVTLQYVDMESHKKALQIEQTRLMELLEQAENIEDIIVIEERLSQVRYELESMEAQLRTYDNLIDYSTIQLSINEVERLTPIVEVSAWEKMTTGFANSLVNVGKGIKNFFMFLVIYLPYLIIWAVIIVLFILLIRFIIKKHDKKIQNKKQYAPHNVPSRPAGYPGVYGQAPMKQDEKPEEKPKVKPEVKPEENKK